MQATLFSFPETVYRLSSEISSEAHASTLAQRACQPEARMLCTLKAQYPAASGGEKNKNMVVVDDDGERWRTINNKATSSQQPRNMVI